eukprot:4097383-Ditylum_brightwellii.AAC.1
MHQALKDWSTILRHIERQPTSVLQLVTKYPGYVGYTDSCNLGTGGIWSPSLNALSHIMWQIEWPDTVQQRIQTPANPTGDLMINDLELAGMVFGWLILESTLPDLKHQHVGIFCDNTSATQWAYKLR